MGLFPRKDIISWWCYGETGLTTRDLRIMDFFVLPNNPNRVHSFSNTNNGMMRLVSEEKGDYLQELNSKHITDSHLLKILALFSKFIEGRAD